MREGSYAAMFTARLGDHLALTAQNRPGWGYGVSGMLTAKRGMSTARRLRPGQGCTGDIGCDHLPDGRRLRWHEFGGKDGSPVIYTAGTPMSGLGGASYAEAARAAGLRWISPEKPGYGGSDYQRKRT